MLSIELKIILRVVYSSSFLLIKNYRKKFLNFIASKFSLLLKLDDIIKVTWSQSYKTNFGIIIPFLGVINANFLHTDLCVEIYARNYTKKCLLSKETSFIGLKNVFGLIKPTPKFWRWGCQFYRIASR